MIRLLESQDIPLIVDGFANHNWPKPASLFEAYLKEQQQNQRMFWVAYLDNQFAGYITLKWQSKYASFAISKIPEIMDLNVLPNFRKAGIGSKLLEQAEKVAFTKSNIVGIGVGLYAGSDGGYGSAQRLYIKQGYLPDGKGVTYDYQPTVPGNSYRLDDDLILWFTKKLSPY